MAKARASTEQLLIPNDQALNTFQLMSTYHWLVVLHFSISKEVVIFHKDVNVDCCNPTATPQSINQQDHLTFTSSFPWLEDTDDVTPQLNCTRRLSPKRLPKKKNEFPIVVMALKETQR